MDMYNKEELAKNGFTDDQIDEILDGQEKGLDVSVYARKEFYAIQMHQIKLGLEHDIPVVFYATTDYDWFQMEEIRKGLEQDLDVSRFLDPSITYDRMRQIRLGLKVGIDVTPYIQYPSGIIREIRKSIESHVDIIPYVKDKYDMEQLDVVRESLEKGIDLKPYITNELRAPSIQEIAIGLEKGIDVSVYANTKYSWYQMREIRYGMEHRVDISVYVNPLYDWRQMKEIRLGLESGVDVSQYKSMVLSAKDMQDKRLELEKEQLHECLTEDIPKINTDDVLISVSADGMRAYAQLLDECTLSVDDVVEILKKRHIVYGINLAEIEKLLNNKPMMIQCVVAQGSLPITGADGWYEFFFTTSYEQHPLLREDGSVDYLNTHWYESVKKGQKVAYYHEAQKGKDGCDVMGHKVFAKKGNEKSLLGGKGFTLMPDKKTYLATVDGRAELVGERLEITRMFTVQDINIATGNLKFDGCVHVKGNIGSGVTLKASENIFVDGYVESANIESGGDVVLKNGMNSAGGGSIVAKGNVTGNYFEAVSIKSGGEIRANYCLNCELHAEGKIIISGKNGSITGGVAQATRGIEAFNAGNRAGVCTNLVVGLDRSVRKEISYIEDNIAEINRQLNILENAQAEFDQKLPADVKNINETYLKIENAIYTKKLQQEQFETLLQQKNELREEAKKAVAVIKGVVYDNVVFEFDGFTWTSSKVRNILVKKSGNKIAIYRN